MPPDYVNDNGRLAHLLVEDLDWKASASRGWQARRVLPSRDDAEVDFVVFLQLDLRRRVPTLCGLGKGARVKAACYGENQVCAPNQSRDEFRERQFSGRRSRAAPFSKSGKACGTHRSETFTPAMRKDSPASCKKSILLVRLALFCVMVHGFGPNLAAFGPKLDPSLGYSESHVVESIRQQLRFGQIRQRGPRRHLSELLRFRNHPV